MSFASQYTKQFILKKTGQSNTPTKCQRCLEVGHWTYECKNERKYVKREPRSKQINKDRPIHSDNVDMQKKKKKVVISSESSLSSDSEDEKVTKTKKLSNLISSKLQKGTIVNSSLNELKSDSSRSPTPCRGKEKQGRSYSDEEHSKEQCRPVKKTPRNNISSRGKGKGSTQYSEEEPSKEQRRPTKSSRKKTSVSPKKNVSSFSSDSEPSSSNSLENERTRGRKIVKRTRRSRSSSSSSSSN